MGIDSLNINFLLNMITLSNTGNSLLFKEKLATGLRKLTSLRIRLRESGHLCHSQGKPNEMNDIRNFDDIQILVNAFYEAVRQDELLAPVFASRIPDEAWPAHLQRMYAFWNAILFAEKGFEGNPMVKHLTLPIGEVHFSRWLSLFNATIDRHFEGPKADEARKRAASIADLMNFKINSLRA